MTKARPLPTQERLHEVFHYSPITGEFWKKIKTAKNDDLSKPAGTLNKGDGYIYISVDSGRYVAHRLTWMFITGEDPGEMQVDHRNGDRANNAWHNLRLLTSNQNKQARHREPSHNRNGLPRGVYLQRNGKSYQVKVMKDRVTYLGGTYKTIDEADWVAVMYGYALHGECNTYVKSPLRTSAVELPVEEYKQLSFVLSYS